MENQSTAHPLNGQSVYYKGQFVGVVLKIINNFCVFASKDDCLKSFQLGHSDFNY
jgi:hypothetical protein